MPDQPNECAALLERVAQGDEHAVAELFQRYQEAIIYVIRPRLNSYPRLRRLFDSIDFLQESWKAILTHPEKLRDFATFKHFVTYFAGVARHQVEKAARKHLDTKKRDLRRTRSLGNPTVADLAHVVADPRPSPDEDAASHDVWLRWVASLPQRQQRVVLLLRAGHTYSEIAEILECSIRSIERTVAELRRLPPPCSSRNLRSSVVLDVR